MAIFLSLMRQIDFKLHILIVLNDLDKWVVIPPMLDQSKFTKMHFLNDPKSQKWVLTVFWSLVHWIDFILNISTELNVCTIWLVYHSCLIIQE